MLTDEVEMNKTNNSKLTGNSQILRKNMTKEERHLWYDFLKSLPITVNRQKVIGNYIVDFYIASSKIVIIIVGETHMRFCLRYVANPVKTTAFTYRHYCNHEWLSSFLLESCGTHSA